MLCDKQVCFLDNILKVVVKSDPITNFTKESLFIERYHGFVHSRSYASSKKDGILKFGALIKSYRYSHALITPRFTMWKQIDFYLHLRLIQSKCVNLYLGNVKIALSEIRILPSSSLRCVKTARIRCVFKIYHVTRFSITRNPWKRDLFFPNESIFYAKWVK